MSNNDKPGHPDCHECGGSGTNAASLPCFACHRKANLAARRRVAAPGSKYADFAARMAEGPPLETGVLAVGPMGQPSPYSAAAVEATVDHLRQRIREPEEALAAARQETTAQRQQVVEKTRLWEEARADLCETEQKRQEQSHSYVKTLTALQFERDAYRDSALAAESALRQHADALARILGRDEGLPLSLHLPTVRMVVAGLQEAQRERDDLRNLTESLRVCLESSTGIAERYTDKYKELHDAAHDLLTAADRSDKEQTGVAVERLRYLTLPNPHDCKGLACPCSYPTYGEISAELAKAERQRDDLRDAARAVVDMTDLASCQECNRVATVYVDGSGCYCDAHGEEFGDGRFKDTRNAPAWRRLVGLVKP